MYKVRKCLSIESLKKKDDLSEYISDFKNAEKKSYGKIFIKIVACA